MAKVSRLNLGEWTTELPNKDGMYWHWWGDDSAPFAFHVGKASNGRCFIQMGLAGFTQPKYCDEYGGLWAPCVPPKTFNIEGMICELTEFTNQQHV
ncbi:hypothetical protein [Pseudoalteromonas sp. Of7M-16]|uniref:hypothetical protein n=1 Tax=Pseudoalteromonas sp. Of7M-16 TaxID=2917756 RepID=UPI001EF5EAEF|nr:hypothetical protein [Pseudoalteromonas sp. Of7M-16]MCG7549236.1 hypothetical protein [Pseudoalteromonas sp. Of7M-16]